MWYPLSTARPAFLAQLADLPLQPFPILFQVTIVFHNDCRTTSAQILAWDFLLRGCRGFFVIPPEKETFIVFVLNVWAGQMQPAKHLNILTVFNKGRMVTDRDNLFGLKSTIAFTSMRSECPSNQCCHPHSIISILRELTVLRVETPFTFWVEHLGWIGPKNGSSSDYSGATRDIAWSIDGAIQDFQKRASFSQFNDSRRKHFRCPRYTVFKRIRLVLLKHCKTRVGHRLKDRAYHPAQAAGRQGRLPIHWKKR